MSKKKPLIIGLAVGLVVGLALGATLMRSTLARGLRACHSMVTIVVADQDLAAGTVLTEATVAQRDVPDAFVTTSVIHAEAFERLLGQKVLVELKRGDFLLWSQLEPDAGEPVDHGSEDLAGAAPEG